MNWKLTKTLFIFVFILVNIFLVIVYIDKVNKSQVNDDPPNNLPRQIFGLIAREKSVTTPPPISCL